MRENTLGWPMIVVASVTVMGLVVVGLIAVTCSGHPDELAHGPLDPADNPWLLGDVHSHPGDTIGAGSASAFTTDADPAELFRGVPGGLSDYRTVRAFRHLRFRRPVWANAPPDGTDRIFVLEQHGVIHVFDNTPEAPSTTVCLDISHKVSRRGNEEGLLGLAFHPHFATNGYVFVHYSTTNPRRGVISRFTLTGNPRTVADPRSERIFLEQDQPYSNHNGGGLEFGPDGYLYISFGDGGWAGDPHNHGLNLATWLGTLLRIDIDTPTSAQRPYSIPLDNPFANTPHARPEIFAYGLRNLWRFTFDRASGLCIGGDVGQDKFEEVVIIKKGANYGWRAYEGFEVFNRNDARRLNRDDLEFPIHVYGRDQGGSITGGYVYRGKRLPNLQGAYVYADYNSGRIWALRWNGERVVENRLIAQHREIASFGEDKDGELLLCSFDGGIHTLMPRTEAGQLGTEFPVRLSQTGLFASTQPLLPKPDLRPYDVNVPLWSAGADKHRWIRLPRGERVSVNPDGYFDYPPGTLFVKHFTIETKPGDRASRKPLETRVLVVKPQPDVPLRGFTYVWGDDGTDAYLLTGNARKTLVLTGPDGRRIDREYHFPSQAECLGCHTAAGNFILGFTISQLNRPDTWDSEGNTARRNQLDRLRDADHGLFVETWRPAAAQLPAFPDWQRDPGFDGDLLARQVRAYLDVNCASCHQPDGPGNAAIDLRYTVPLADTNTVNAPPLQGDMGLRSARIIAPGHPDRSTLAARMSTTGPGTMPTIGHTSTDRTAITRLRRWIADLPTPPPSDDPDAEDF